MSGWAVAQALIFIQLAAGVAGIDAIATAQAQSPASLAVLIQQARAGIAKAEFNLGAAYDKGAGGLPKSPAQAVQWYQRAAAQGYAPAEYNLGVMYDGGEDGLLKSPAQAVQWYQRAAAQGYAPAENNLGVAYHTGEGGLPKSDVQAVQWYQRAAVQRYAPAIVELRWLQHQQQEAVRQSRPQSPQVAVVHSARSTPAAPPADHQRVVQSLQLFWNIYFRASDAHVVDFGAPALVSPVSFGSGS